MHQSAGRPAHGRRDRAAPRPADARGSDFLEGDAPAAAKVEAFLARALDATGTDANITAGALVPWICNRRS